MNARRPNAALEKESGAAHRKELSSAMDRMVLDDKATEGFHRDMVREGIVKRYAFATELRENPRLFMLWQSLPRIVALPRPPKSADQAFKALCNATYADKRKASKYWCRVREFWLKKSAASEVLEFLKSQGIEKGPAERKAPPKEDDEPSFLSLVFQSKESMDVYTSARHIAVSGRIDNVKGSRIFLTDVVTSVPRN